MDSSTNNAGSVEGAASDRYISNSVQTAEEAVQTAEEELSYDTTAINATADFAGVLDEAVESYNWNTEEYNAVEESGFQSVANNPLSTFSADVDTASYSNIRRMIEAGYSLDEIPSGAVRIEEMLNYFSYDYRLPRKNEPFGVTTVIGDCPWNEDAKLLQIGLKTEEIDFSEALDSNLVFLLDVSGSMYSDDKLPLLQKSFSMLVQELGEKDTVSIVTYAGSDRVILEGESGDNKEGIIEALDALEAGGSTNGADGIETAYALAEKYFIKDGNNRVILATDGDLNVGVSSESELHKLITEKKESGV
ncbi:MAG: von Willebrand factor type A domain-containing protein, partial [Lachnospiraceae bacterium]|nr:von Willebrand factor type A domain-containing protein [Lachnospiraceae bacterium]